MTFALMLFASLSQAALPAQDASELPAQGVAALTHDVAEALRSDARPDGLFGWLGGLFGRDAAEPDAAPSAVEAAVDALAEVEAEPPLAPLLRFAGYERDWHDTHDEMIQRVVAEFNEEKGWGEDHPHRLDPNLVKAWALQESGGHQEIFTSGDMMQMNNRGDWAPEKEWFGVRLGERLSPEESLRAALDWAYYKGEATRPMRGEVASEGWYPTQRGTRAFPGYESRFTGWKGALRDYNGGGVADYWGDIARKLGRASLPSAPSRS